MDRNKKHNSLYMGKFFFLYILYNFIVPKKDQNYKFSNFGSKCFGNVLFLNPKFYVNSCSFFNYFGILRKCMY